MTLRNKNKNYAQQRFNRCELSLTIFSLKVGKGAPLQTLRASNRRARRAHADRAPVPRRAFAPRALKPSTTSETNRRASFRTLRVWPQKAGLIRPYRAGGRQRREGLPFSPSRP